MFHAHRAVELGCPQRQVDGPARLTQVELDVSERGQCEGASTSSGPSRRILTPHPPHRRQSGRNEPPVRI
jgi:hypothetical protein